MSASVEALRKQSLDWLRQRYGNVYVNQRAVIVVPFNETAVFVAVDAAVVATGPVNVSAPVLLDVLVTPDLTLYVAANGGNFLYGSLSLYQEQQIASATVEFDYSLFGETVTQQLLELVVAMVAGSAAQEQKKMQPLFGGRSLMEGG